MENEQILEAELLTDRAYTWEAVEHFAHGTQGDLNNQNEKKQFMLLGVSGEGPPYPSTVPVSLS